jgi:CPA2 family monovalent cation:H+ antiporter-2
MIPSLVEDLALILIVASIVTLIFKRLKQPLVLGYIVAGFLVSPHMPYPISVIDETNIELWAEIGVIFLLFALGLEFSIKKILKMGAAPIIAALTIIFCMSFLGVIAGHSFGWPKMDCIFLAGMVAMSSTTIIYKAFNDMGLMQQAFASSVTSVLILEDILAIVLMVMLSAIAGGNTPDGSQLLSGIGRIGYFLVLWFVIGLFIVPIILRKTRKLMNDETLLVVSLGLCCLMAVIASKVGFSAAFGAFIMGSIIAETIEADRIIHLVEPVKNLFGSIFFVSVGMLVEPKVLVDYAVPIAILVLTILGGQAIFGSLGYLLGGQNLKNAMRCGFSMAQVGEFAFIIASMGLSLHVISSFLYPVVVAVSVITTFLTPYMIRVAEPAYNRLIKLLPKKMVRQMDHISEGAPETNITRQYWKSLGKQIVMNTVIYGILSGATIVIMFSFILQPCRNLSIELTGNHWTGNAVCGLLTLSIIAPFLRSMVMKKNKSKEFRYLWTENHLNRFPLIFTVLARIVIASAFVFYIFNYLTRFTNALIITIALVIMVIMVMSRGLKRRSIKLERVFIENLRSREIADAMRGKRRPLFANGLFDRDIHIGSYTIPNDSKWAGMTLAKLQLRNRFGVHASSVIRGTRRINIPDGDTVIFPGDQIQVIGDDEQLARMSTALNLEIYEEDPHIEKHEMKLRKMVITSNSPFIGKTLRDSGIREKYDCMVVGVEEGQEKLTMISPSRCFEKGDIIWLVGEEHSLQQLMSE